MDYEEYYMRVSEEADELQAEMELGKKPKEIVSEGPKGFIPKPPEVEDEEPEDTDSPSFNAAYFIARIRSNAKVTEQISEVKKGKGSGTRPETE